MKFVELIFFHNSHIFPPARKTALCVRLVVVAPGKYTRRGQPVPAGNLSRSARSTVFLAGGRSSVNSVD